MRLQIRADASATIGTGHVMRCLALTQAWRDLGGQVDWWQQTLPKSLSQRLVDEGIQLHALESLDPNELTTRLPADASWLVVDGYPLIESEPVWAAAGLKLLAIDDFQREHPAARLILNQNLGASMPAAPGQTQQNLLLGPRYALLRREFRQLGPAQTLDLSQAAEHTSSLLVTFGGSDPPDLTSRSLAALALLPADSFKQARVLVGGANPRAQALAEQAQKIPNVEMLHDVADIVPLLLNSDLVLSAAGSTCWELCCLGRPALIAVLADNQTDIAQALQSSGCAQSLGWHGDLTPKTIAQALLSLSTDAPARASMRERGRALVDGQGTLRVLSAMGLTEATA